MKTESKKIVVLIIFSIAMAALESAVVVYLRALYYKDGFTVAFRLIDEHILTVEIIRELATLIMLIGIGYLTGKNRNERFAYFLLSFAVWDIFYYVWLKVFINWPASLFDWDILFLIPITWLGPVIAPIICSVTMIALTYAIIKKAGNERLPKHVFYTINFGALLILFSFLQDYIGLLLKTNTWIDYPQLLKNKKFIDAASVYIPDSYNWLAFCTGEILICVSIFLLWFTIPSFRSNQHTKQMVLNRK